jgi:hypothetical protein
MRPRLRGHHPQRRPALLDGTLLDDVGHGGHAPHAFGPRLAHEDGRDGLFLNVCPKTVKGAPNKQNISSHFIHSG